MGSKNNKHLRGSSQALMALILTAGQCMRGGGDRGVVWVVKIRNISEAVNGYNTDRITVYGAGDGRRQGSGPVYPASTPTTGNL